MTETTAQPTKKNHRWKFFRAGGFDQVRLESGSDLRSLDQLDQKLWVALACPAQGLEFDTRTLSLIDGDKDGRIRAPDIIAATQWTLSLLKDPDDLLRPSQGLPLKAINEANPAGAQLIASARQVLVNLGHKDSEIITVEDVSDKSRIFAQTNLNGDGIITADGVSDPSAKAAVNEIISCLGSEQDRSGKPGVSQLKVDQFFAELQAYLNWGQAGESDNGKIHILGPSTVAAANLLETVRNKIDDYFARCRLAAFDPRAQAALNRQESEYLAVAAKDLSIQASEVAGFPLAQVAPNKPLPLNDGVNPAWAESIATLRANVVKPILGDKESLTEGEWKEIKNRLQPYFTWLAEKKGGSVEKLGIKRLREIQNGSVRKNLTDLILADKAKEMEANNISDVEKLVRFHRDLYKLLNNFVNFSDFYGRHEKAVFQSGTLYLDQRSCDLCLRVDDPARHAAMAGLAGTYLAYCDCTRKATGEKMQIVAAFTDGDSDNLMVGRNGIFYDRQGRDWDATISKIIDNPISIRQAFMSPYKRFVRLLEEQVAKRAAAADAAASDKLSALATSAVQVDKTKPAEPKKVDVGTVAALGVALGAIGTAISALVTGLLKLPGWQMPLVFLSLILVISGPSMVIAWLKLRKRNMGPILDANGWAINTRARINLPFGRLLTKVAKLPSGSERSLTDPYAESHSGRRNFIAILFLLVVVWALWNFGVIEKAVPGLLPKSRWLQYQEEHKRTNIISVPITIEIPATNKPAAP